MQMIDVHLPTTDGRKLILPRYTQPEKELVLLLHQLHLTLPDQPPRVSKSWRKNVGQTFERKSKEYDRFTLEQVKTG